MNLWETVGTVAAGLALVWVVLLGLLYLAARREQRQVSLSEALRLVPDILRLLRDLAGDGTLPLGVRLRLVALFAYLALPIDLVPDFIPVVGYADDVVVVALVLRSVTRAAGPEAVTRHWAGSADGLRVVKRLAGLPERTHPAG